MDGPQGFRSVTSLKPGDHVCLLFESDEQHRAVVTTYVLRGLVRGEKALYLADDLEGNTARQLLHDSKFRPYLADGQLVVFPGHEAFLNKGSFDPEHAIVMLRNETVRAGAEGYAALRVAGDMALLQGLEGSERWLDYETALEAFLSDSTALGMCQYDRRRCSPDILYRVLALHHARVRLVGDQPVRHGRLQITPLHDRCGLRLEGELDLASTQPLARALEAEILPGANLYIDLAAVSFADLGGLRVFLHIALRLNAGQRLFLVSASPRLRRMLETLGWDQTPNLTFVERIAGEQ